MVDVGFYTGGGLAVGLVGVGVGAVAVNVVIANAVVVEAEVKVGVRASLTWAVSMGGGTSVGTGRNGWGRANSY